MRTKGNKDWWDEPCHNRGGQNPEIFLPTNQATGKVLKTNANAGTSGDHTMASSESLTVSHRERGATSATAKSGGQSAPPSEPEAVTALRHDARTGRSMVPNDRIRTVVDYIDTLSARLKRAEGLLHRAVPFLADNGHMEQQIENFLAEKGDA